MANNCGSTRLAVSIVVHDDTYCLRECLASCEGLGPVFVFVSRAPWRGNVGDWNAAREVASATRARVIVGEWNNEFAHRKVAFEQVKSQGYSHVVLLDADEVLDEEACQSLSSIAQGDIADQVRLGYVTHWKGSDFVIDPPEPYCPLVMVKCATCTYAGNRDFTGGNVLILSGERYGVHHFGYCGPNERIARKLAAWRHSEPVVREWYAKVWLGWDECPYLEELHPTLPSAYQAARLVEPLPALRRLAWQLEVPANDQFAATTSIIIPLHGGEEEIRQCLASIEPYHHKLDKVVVVDNASPDGAADAVREHPWVQLVAVGDNLGLGSACNLGLNHVQSRAVIFLNSDTLVPEVAVHHLIASLFSREAVAAVGPFTNYAGYGQALNPTYSNLDNLDRFANLFARSTRPDIPTDMLVGFCIALKTEIMKKIGGFDPIFGIGLWEDNDLSYRLIREGYRLLRVTRSFIHHHGSKTLERTQIDQQSLYEENRQKFEQKWSADLASGFSSGLSGISGERIVFRRKKSQALANEGERHLASAICCTCARPRLLEEAIACFLLQDYEPKELIIVNDLAEQPLVLAEPDPRIRIVNVASRFSSLGAKRNFAKSLAKGEYVLIWDDDDIHLPWRIGESIRLLENFEEYDGVRAMTSLFSVANDGYQLYESGLFGQSCFRAAFAQNALYDEDVSCGEDWRFDRLGCMCGVDPTPCFWMICRWGLGIYHISGRGEDDQVLNWNLAADNARRVAEGCEALRPALRRNYLEDVDRFLSGVISPEQFSTWRSFATPFFSTFVMAENFAPAGSSLVEV